jgi:sugar/nucleoside kinase (ribokinase family)
MQKTPFRTGKGQTVVGIGSALVDILIHEEDEFLSKTNAAKGGMTLVEKVDIDRFLAMSSGEASIVPGGSACNTVIGVGNLGGSARFVGKCGKDEFATLFENNLKQQDVDPALLQTDSPTGRVLSIITPDAQRSMFTFLGASAEMQPAEINLELFRDTAILHVEGYLLFNPDLIRAVLAAAQQSKVKVSLDLASYTVVEASRELLGCLVDQYVDILIANEEEAEAFTGYRDEHEALEALADRSEIAVLKVGRRGSYVSHAGRTATVKPMGGGKVVDTTGAGDLWAAGFLFGLVKGYSMEACGRLASACGYEVCRVTGAAIPPEGWERIRKLLA